MSNSISAQHLSMQWLVHHTALPLIRRQCLTCASGRFRTTGAFRVNAHAKKLDIWLLAICVGCEQTIKLEIQEQVHVRTVDPARLDQLHRNDAGLVLRLLTDPAVLRRNRVTLDWQDAWELQANPTKLCAGWVIDVAVRFEHSIPVRLVRLLALGLGIPRAAAERLITTRQIASTCTLPTTVSRDFSFTLRVP